MAWDSLYLKVKRDKRLRRGGLCEAGGSEAGGRQADRNGEGWSRTRGGNPLRVNSGGCRSPGAGELSTAGVRVETWDTLSHLENTFQGTVFFLHRRCFLPFPQHKRLSFVPVLRAGLAPVTPPSHFFFSLYLQDASGDVWGP